MNRFEVVAAAFCVVLVGAAAVWFFFPGPSGWRVYETSDPGVAPDAEEVARTDAGDFNLTWEGRTDLRPAGFGGLYESPVPEGVALRFAFRAEHPFRAEVELRDGGWNTTFSCAPGDAMLAQEGEDYAATVEHAAGACAVDVVLNRALHAENGVQVVWGVESTPPGGGELGAFRFESTMQS